jgi:hypothetical protein
VTGKERKGVKPEAKSWVEMSRWQEKWLTFRAPSHRWPSNNNDHFILASVSSNVIQHLFSYLRLSRTVMLLVLHSAACVDSSYIIVSFYSALYAHAARVGNPAGCN